MLAAWSVRSAVAAVLLLSLVQGKKEFMDINTEKLFSGWDSMLRRAETEASAVHLRRQLQQSRLGQSIVGYVNILLYNDASCSSEPNEAVTYAYGFCDSIPGRSTGSRVTLLTTPYDGSSKVITNTTQLFSDDSCNFPSGNPIAAPVVLETGAPEVVGRCFSAKSITDYAGSGNAGAKVNSLSSYIPGSSRLFYGGASLLVTYRSLSDCQGKTAPTKIQSLSARSSPSSESEDYNCQADSSSRFAPPTYVSACSYGSCAPTVGIAPVLTSPALVIAGFVKVRDYSYTTDCSGDFHEWIFAFGECERDFNGVFNRNSRTRTFSTDASGSVIIVYQFYSDSACRVASGAPVTVQMKTPTGGGKIKVGSCFNPIDASVSAAKVSYLLESIGTSMPSFSTSGLMTTDFQSKGNCDSKLGITSYSVINSAICLQGSASSSSYLTIACNSTTVTYSYFSDAKCQTPAKGRNVDVQKLQSCYFTGGDSYFSDSTDASLYYRQACNVAPSSQASDSNSTTMIIGVVCGVVGVILLGLFVAYCWSQASKEGDVGGGMAGQDANAIDYSQQYPGPPEMRQEMVNSHVATLRNSWQDTRGPPEMRQEMVNSHVSTLRNSWQDTARAVDLILAQRGSVGGEGPYGGSSFDNRGSHGGRGPGRLGFDSDRSGRP